MAGLDIERAAADGTTQHHQAALLYQWAQITRLLGADSEPRSITYETVQRYVAARRAEGAMGQTVVREVQALKRACAEAHERGWMPVVPRRWPSVRRDPVGAKRTGKLHPPSIIAQWLEALPEDARDKAEVAALTSLRDAELGRVTAQWIEPAPDGAGVPALLRVPARSSKSRRVRPPLPLVQRALDILKRRIAALPPDAPSDTPLLPGNHKRAYRTARKAIGYEPTISHRDLRHTWATLGTAAAGVHAARDVLGHTSLATTSRYVHGTLESGITAALAVEALVGRVDSAEEAKTVSESCETPCFTGAGNGARTRDPQLGKLISTALDHVATCKTCLNRVLSCASLRVVDGDLGRGESAEAPSRTGLR